MTTNKQSDLDCAIEALALAAQCGGELDLDQYKAALVRLTSLKKKIQEHDQTLNERAICPDGDDYNWLYSEIMG